jgi:hypothetical protein
LSRLAPCTPADIVNKLSAAIQEGLKSESVHWSAAVKLAGIKPE